MILGLAMSIAFRSIFGGDPFAKYIGLDGETIDLSDKTYSSAQIDYLISIFATCTNCTIDISGTNDHRTAASNDDLNDVIAGGNTITLNDVLGAELHTSLNAANDSATEAITAFADYSSTISGATKVTIGQDITDMLPLGSEVIDQQDMSGGNWTRGSITASWDGTENTCDAVGAGGYAYNLETVTPGKYYTFNFEAKNIDANSVEYAVYDHTNSAWIVSAVDYYSLIGTGSYTKITITFRVPYTCTQIRVYVIRSLANTESVYIKNIVLKEIQVLGSDLVTNGGFVNWTGDNPDNWTVQNEDGNNYITEDSGKARIVSDNSAAIQMYQNVFTPSKYYLVTVSCTAAVSGQVNVGHGGNYINVTNVQSYSKVIQASSGYIFIIRSGACDITIDNVSVHELTVTKEIAASTNYTGTHYVLPIDENNFAIPVSYVAESIVAQKITGETNATTGWTESGLNGTGANVFESQESVVNDGLFALKAEANDTPYNGANFHKDFSVENGAVYRFTVQVRHVGTGGGWGIRDVDGYFHSIATEDTTFQQVTFYKTMDSTGWDIIFREQESNNGGIYMDNFSLKKVTLS